MEDLIENLSPHKKVKFVEIVFSAIDYQPLDIVKVYNVSTKHSKIISQSITN